MMDRIANPSSVLAYITDRAGTRFKCYDLATRFKTNTTEMRAILEIIKDKIKISSTFKDKIYFVPSAAEIATQERQMRAQTTRPLQISMAKRQSFERAAEVYTDGHHIKAMTSNVRELGKS